MPEEQMYAPSHDGSVVLDIGGDVGALVIHVRDVLVGRELHVTGLEPGTVSTHTLVRERRLAHGVQFAAVFPGLPQGAYALHRPHERHEHAGHEHAGHEHAVQHLDHKSAETVHITGGGVTEIDWRDATDSHATSTDRHAHVGG